MKEERSQNVTIKNEVKGRGLFYGVIAVATFIIMAVGTTFAYFTATTESMNSAVQTGSTTLQLQYISYGSAWIKNDKQREAFYRDALKSCDSTQLIAIIKNMFERKQDRLASGKSAIVVDDKYFKLAEEQLFSELAFALGMKKEEM